MLAAFLPLPPQPPILADDVETTPRRQSSVQELNEAFAQQDVRRYQKARWWRVMNRAMSFVGSFVVAAVVRCLSCSGNVIVVGWGKANDCADCACGYRHTLMMTHDYHY